MITLRSSGFWSLTLGFFLLMQSNQTPIPAAPGGEMPSFSNQTESLSPVELTSGKVMVSAFEKTGCAECHAFALHTLMPLHELYQHNPMIQLKVYVVPEGEEGLDMAKNLICAEEQSKFWPLYNQLHSREGILNSAEIETLMTDKNMEIDLEKLKTCLQAEETSKTLNDHRLLLEKAELDLFPTVFVENTKLIHTPPLENLMYLISQKSLEAEQEMLNIE